MGSWQVLVLTIVVIPIRFPMSNNRSWSILNWNVRVLTAKDKWLVVKHKIEERACGIVCLQETKREHFDQAYINIFFALLE